MFIHYHYEARIPKMMKGHLPDETEIQDIAFVEALNFCNKFPDRESISHIIPSAPAV